MLHEKIRPLLYLWGVMYFGVFVLMIFGGAEASVFSRKGTVSERYGVGLRGFRAVSLQLTLSGESVACSTPCSLDPFLVKSCATCNVTTEQETCWRHRLYAIGGIHWTTFVLFLMHTGCSAILLVLAAGTGDIVNTLGELVWDHIRVDGASRHKIQQFWWGLLAMLMLFASIDCGLIADGRNGPVCSRPPGEMERVFTVPYNGTGMVILESLAFDYGGGAIGIICAFSLLLLFTVGVVVLGMSVPSPNKAAFKATFVGPQTSDAELKHRMLQVLEADLQLRFEDPVHTIQEYGSGRRSKRQTSAPRDEVVAVAAGALGPKAIQRQQMAEEQLYRKASKPSGYNYNNHLRDDPRNLQHQYEPPGDMDAFHHFHAEQQKQTLHRPLPQYDPRQHRVVYKQPTRIANHVLPGEAFHLHLPVPQQRSRALQQHRGYHRDHNRDVPPALPDVNPWEREGYPEFVPPPPRDVMPIFGAGFVNDHESRQHRRYELRTQLRHLEELRLMKTMKAASPPSNSSTAVIIEPTELPAQPIPVGATADDDTLEKLGASPIPQEAENAVAQEEDSD